MPSVMLRRWCSAEFVGLNAPSDLCSAAELVTAGVGFAFGMSKDILGADVDETERRDMRLCTVGRTDVDTVRCRRWWVSIGKSSDGSELGDTPVDPEGR